MMANTTINLVGLDFNSIKENLRDYLKRTESPFKDYLYEGSNMSALLDVLAYNTYLNNYYLNMVASEMFLDTAQLRDSVISHAKELNYVPRSFRSSVARINFTITPSSALGSIVVPKGATFTSKIGSNNFTFSVAENFVVTANNDDGKFYVTTNIYEGTYTTDTFTYTTNTSNKYILSNPTIDLSSLTISVVDNGGSTLYEYNRANSYLGVAATSNVFFVQAAPNEQYEVFFGDNVIGSAPAPGSTIVARYRMCSGELSNGCRIFTIDGPIQGQSNISTISTIFSADGGAISESTESIKRNAPRYYQNQERAVTASDYENMLIQRFPEIQAVSAFGGEDLDPPQYGKVFIAADVVNADGTPEITKQKFLDYLRPRVPLSIDPVIVNPDFLYCKVDTIIKYNINQTSLKQSDINTLAALAISNYSNTYLNGFKKTLRYSRLSNIIDTSHTSIISNKTEITPYKEIVPLLNQNNIISVDFGFEINSRYNLSPSHEIEEYHAISSSSFTYNNQTCFIEDDGNGNLNLTTIVNYKHTVLKSIGSINYATGILNINGLYLTGYEGSAIRIYAVPVDNDITSRKGTILTIRDTDITTTSIEYRE